MDGERVDLGELEVFVTLADELHFGRTAERLLLSQPRVSQLLRSLENRVGGRLFDRTSRRVALTPLGQVLLRSTKPLYDGLGRALREARAVASGLRIGFLGGLAGALDGHVAEFRREHPVCPLTMTETPWTDFYGPLRRGEVDLQVTLLPVDEPDLTAGPVIAEYARLLTVAAWHPLAKLTTASLDDLAGQSVIAAPEGAPATVLTGPVPPATPKGRPIRRGPTAHTQQEAFNLVAQTGSVCPTTEATVRYFRHPGLVFIPLPDLPPARTVLVWPTATRNEKILRFAARA